jgi:hypothetical protein
VRPAAWLGLPIDELFQVFRQQADIGHLRAVQQHWNDRNAAGKRLANLDAHEIVPVVESSPFGFRVARIDPSGTDQREQHSHSSTQPLRVFRKLAPGGIESTSMNTWSLGIVLQNARWIIRA